jgi:hypothetical protein
MLISTASSWFSFVIGGHVAGLSVYRELDDALELTTIAGQDARRGAHGAGVALMRLSGFSGSQYLAVLLAKRT